MKTSIKKKTGVYTYLNGTKVLETGSDHDIAKARQDYWKAYKAAWRKQRRIVQKEFTLFLTAAEAKIIADAARQHRRSKSAFIRNAAFAYLRRQYLVPDPLALASIRQLLAVNYNALQKLFDENRMPYEIGKVLLSQMAELEQKVINELYHPKERKETIE